MAEEFLLKIITPERVFYEEMVTMVEFNTTEGEIGVYKNHIPLTVIVKPGILTITTKDGVMIFNKNSSAMPITSYFTRASTSSIVPALRK